MQLAFLITLCRQHLRLRYPAIFRSGLTLVEFALLIVLSDTLSVAALLHPLWFDLETGFALPFFAMVITSWVCLPPLFPSDIISPETIKVGQSGWLNGLRMLYRFTALQAYGSVMLIFLILQTFIEPNQSHETKIAINDFANVEILQKLFTASILRPELHLDPGVTQIRYLIVTDERSKFRLWVIWEFFVLLICVHGLSTFPIRLWLISRCFPGVLFILPAVALISYLPQFFLGYLAYPWFFWAVAMVSFVSLNVIGELVFVAKVERLTCKQAAS